MTARFLEKLNPCFPLLDEIHVKAFEETASPALKATVCASTLIYWKSSPSRQPISHHCPDIRFVWTQALKALNNELLYSPDINSIIAGIVNVGGRPTTTMTGNAIFLGSCVSLAHSLGLNRDPSSWDISLAEKSSRIRIWWCLFVHDMW